MAFTLPTVDASKTVEDLGAFSLGSIHTVVVSGFADDHIYGSSAQLGGLPTGLTVTGASLMSHTPEAPLIEFKISLGVCGLDLAAILVALRRLGSPS